MFAIALLQESIRAGKLAILARQAIEDAGLQVPSSADLGLIILCSYNATALLWAAALRQPTPSGLDEMFHEFVVRAVNCASGGGDGFAN